MFGKKIYKTSMLNIFRLGILAIVIFFLNDFILNTYTYENFQADGRFKLVDVLKYHYKYPAEFIGLCFMVLFPAFYYSIIRGVRFFDKGLIVNLGVPFFNRKIPYEDVAIYKLLHPEHLLIIQTTSGEIFPVFDNSLERVIAILDQHNIPGDLAKDGYTKLLARIKRFILVLLFLTLLVFVLKKFGLFLR